MKLDLYLPPQRKNTFQLHSKPGGNICDVRMRLQLSIGTGYTPSAWSWPDLGLEKYLKF